MPRGRPPVYGPGNAAGKKMFRRARKAARAPKKVTKKAVTAIVKRTIASQEEKKYQQLTTTGITYNSSISTTGEWYNPIPVINQGVGAFQRDGNIIRPTVLDMTWHVSLGVDVTRSCDDTVVLYLFKCKNLTSYSDMVARGSAGVFLDKGSQGLAPFTGLLTDVACPLNNDAFTLVAKRVFKLTKGLGALNGELGAYSGAGGITSKRINIKMRNLPRFMYQQGNTDGLPENYGLCWAIGYAKSDGSAPDVVNQDIRVDFVSNLFYTDA